MQSIPAVVLTFFVVSCIGANLLANKSINLPFDWMALDCGILFSWLSFLSMDIIVKRFGAKAATEVSLTACAINLLVCFVFFVASFIPGMWGESFVDNGDIVNISLNNTFGGTWYVLLGSTIAFISSAIINNTLNSFIGKLRQHDKDSFKTYALRSYISTVVGQFFDNLIFALIVSLNFFGWTFIQCLMCSAIGAIVELVCEVVFSPIGYNIVKRWELSGIGKEYLKGEQ